MNNYLLLFFVAALVLTGCRPEDKDAPTPGDNFIKYHGGAGEDIAVDMVLDEAIGYFILVGNSNSNIDGQNSSGLQSIYLVKTDLEGNETHRPLMIQYPDYNTTVSKIRKSTDGTSVLIAGTVDSVSRSRMFWAIVNIEDDLDSVASGLIGVQTGASEDKFVVGADIIETRDGNLAILGTEEEALNRNDQNQQKQVVIAKIMINGTVIWKKYIGFDGDDDAAAFHQFDNGDFGVLATTDEQDDDGRGGKNLQFFLLDSIGGVLAEQTYGNAIEGNTNLDDVATDVIKISTGFAILGNSNNSGTSVPFIVTLSNEGIKSTQVSLQGYVFGKSTTTPSNIGYGIARSGGDFIVIGEFPSFSSGGDNTTSKQGEISFIRTDQGGKIISHKNFGTNTGSDKGATAISFSDGSIAVLGTTDLGGGRTMMTLMKVNRNGNFIP